MDACLYLTVKCENPERKGSNNTEVFCHLLINTFLFWGGDGNKALWTYNSHAR